MGNPPALEENPPAPEENPPAPEENLPAPEENPPAPGGPLPPAPEEPLPPAPGGGNPPAPSRPTSNGPNPNISLSQNLYNTAKLTTENAHNIIDSAISHRLEAINLNDNIIISSGDRDTMAKHVWISYTIANSKYKGGTLSKHSSKTKAGTIGIDYELINGSIIGGSYSYLVSNFKYKDSSDKASIDTHILSLYGQTNLTKKLMLQGVASVGFGNTTIKSLINNQMTEGKVKNTSYGTKLAIARNIKLGKAIITPHIGLKYGRFNIGGYNQGIGNQHLSVTANKENNFSAIIGASAFMPIKIGGTTQLIPGLHIGAEKFLSNKQKMLSAEVNSQKILLPVEKAAKYNYVIGSSVSVKKNRTEIMVVYDYISSGKKYSSNQGSIKLRISL